MSKTRIKYGPWTPWSEVLRSGNTTKVGGIASDIYDSVSKALNEEFEITVQEDFVFGSLGSEGKWSGMLGAMQRNETDLSGPYFLTAERASLVEFSAPIGFTELAVVTGLEPANRDPFIVLRIFTLHVWLLIIMSTIVATAVASFIYAVLPTRKKRTKAETFLKYAWMFYGTLLGKDLGSPTAWFLRHVLIAVSFRILLCAWLVGSVLVLMYTYQGAITSTLAADKLRPVIQTLDELDKNKMVTPSTFGTSITSICFEQLKGTKMHSLYLRVFQNLKYVTKGNYPDWLDDVESGKLAFVGETSFMKSIVGERYKGTGKCGIRVIPIGFCSSYIAFAFRKMYRPKLQNVFNQRSLWYAEGHLYHRHKLASSLQYDTCSTGNSGVIKALNVKNIFGAFLIYITGVSLSVFIFFMEKLIKCKKLS